MLRFTDNLIMQTTLDCNFNCKYCMQGLQNEKTERFHHKKLTFDEAKQIIDYTLYERCILGDPNNFINFHLHGGEPTLLGEDLLLKIANYILERQFVFPNISLCIQTNGYLLTEKLCQFFADNNISIGVSFDGFTDDEMHGYFGKKEDLLKKLQDLQKKTGVLFGFLSVITKNNVKSLYADSIKLSKMFKDAKCFGVNILCDAGNGSKKEIPNIQDVWKYYYLPILNDIKYNRDTFRNFTLNLIIDDLLKEIIFTGINRPEFFKTGCFNKLCGFGSNMISIDPDLNLSPCDKWMDNGKYINLRPRVTYNRSDFLGLQHLKYVVDYYDKFFKLDKKIGCDTCPVQHVCPGQCQAYQISILGHIDQDSDLCWLYNQIYNFILKNWVYIINDKPRNLKGENLFNLNFNTTALAELKKHKKKIYINKETKEYYLGDIKI